MPDAFLTALRSARPEHPPEVVPVVVHGLGSASFVMEVGDELITFDAAELRSALDEAEAA